MGLQIWTRYYLSKRQPVQHGQVTVKLPLTELSLFLCPRIERWGTYCFTIVHLSVCLYAQTYRENLTIFPYRENLTFPACNALVPQCFSTLFTDRNLQLF